MGLTIHYCLHADAPNADAARQLVEQLHQAAMDLPFAEVRDVVELASDSTRFEDAQHGNAKWLLVQAMHLVESEAGQAMVQPDQVVAFTAWPGPGCEVANFGLCRYPATIGIAGKTVATGVDGWHWESFCKTQYASNTAEGGIENFLRCHLLIVKLLDHAERLGILKQVKDEGGYWQSRDVAALTREIGRWNQFVAGIAGQFKDGLGDDFLAPIRDYPDFEHLEAKGRGPSEATAPVPQPGDRIRLIAMPDDPDPIEAGQTGTVVSVRRHDDTQGTWHQIDVAWDNGRTLMLVSPPDRFEIVGDQASRA